MDVEKNIKELGVFTGNLLFFGGVYSNLQALQALKNWATTNGYTGRQIFCTGDIVGYCAQPIECLELIKEWGIHCIAGNVELQLRNDEADCGCDFTSGGRCDIFSKNWYAYAQAKVTREMKEWLHTLPHHIQFEYGMKRITLVHGSWFQTAEFIFHSTPWEIKKKNLVATASSVIIAGHGGIPFTENKKDKWWLNAGSIGMPANDGSADTWFMTLNESNLDTLQPVFHRLDYDYKLASDLMREKELPITYANSLVSGIWDNCEILPEQETRVQGVKILL